METVPRDRMGWQEGCRLGSIVKQVSPPTPAPSSLYTVAVLLYRKRIYICKVCCKMREKKKTMSTKKNLQRKKIQIHVFCGFLLGMGVQGSI